jgi:hypothetical protein
MDQRVGQWMRFEAVLENRTAYADPYRDVAMQAAYQRPDGSVLHTWGFYDGGQTWRARCMPDQVGTWHYALTFSDGAPGASGRFVCVPPTTGRMASGAPFSTGPRGRATTCSPWPATT